MSIKVAAPISKQDYYVLNFLDGDKKGERRVRNGRVFVKRNESQSYIHISNVRPYVTGSDIQTVITHLPNLVTFKDFLLVWITFSTNFSNIVCPSLCKSWSIVVDYSLPICPTTVAQDERLIYLDITTSNCT